MLDAHVLVLNRHYQPVRITDARRALVMLYVGAVRALDADFRLFDFPSWTALASELDDETVGTVNRRIRIPRIVVLQVYDRVPIGRVRFSRHNIFARDDHTCQYCDQRLTRKQLNLDHVIPRSQGGKTNWENVVTSCIECNVKKGGKTPQQAGMHLVKKPKKPSWADLIRPPSVRARYREWLPFLNPVDASYWNVELESD
jgi:5-methylcytosine-specific restriction endonuclease McrA